MPIFFCPCYLLEQTVRAEKGLILYRYNMLVVYYSSLQPAALYVPAYEYIKMLLTGFLTTLISAILHNWVHKKSSHEDLDRSIHHLNCVSWVIRWMLDANVWTQMKWALNCVFTKLFSSLLFFILLPPASNRSLKLLRTYGATDKG